MRIRHSGIVEYQWAKSGDRLLFPLSGALYVYDPGREPGDRVRGWPTRSAARPMTPNSRPKARRSPSCAMGICTSSRSRPRRAPADHRWRGYGPKWRGRARGPGRDGPPQRLLVVARWQADRLHPDRRGAGAPRSAPGLPRRPRRGHRAALSRRRRGQCPGSRRRGRRETRARRSGWIRARRQTSISPAWTGCPTAGRWPSRSSRATKRRSTSSLPTPDRLSRLICARRRTVGSSCTMTCAFSRASERFLWASERDGFKHLYL